MKLGRKSQVHPVCNHISKLGSDPTGDHETNILVHCFANRTPSSEYTFLEVHKFSNLESKVADYH